MPAGHGTAGHTTAGKAAANVVIVAILALMTLALLINFKVADALFRPAKGVVTAVGVSQSWAVFAPTRRDSLYLDTRTDFADGSFSTSRFPNHLGFWDFVDYHWKIYGDHARATPAAREPLARYLAGRDRAPGREPVTVTLITTWTRQNPPGKEPSQGPWRSDPFHTLHLVPPTGPGHP